MTDFGFCERAAREPVIAPAMERPAAVRVYFDRLGYVNGESIGNAVTEAGGDPIEYDITEAEYTQKYPDHLYRAPT